jgi:hypothetical protein
MVLLTGAALRAQDAGAAAPQAAPTPQAEYGGPANLDRGGEATVLHGGEHLTLTPFVAAMGEYSSDFGGYGATGLFGVLGGHDWSTSELKLDYHGLYQWYSNVSGEDGLDNVVNVSYTHQFNARLGLDLTEDLARVHNSYSLPFGSLYGGTGSFDPLYNALAGTGISNTPTLGSVGGARLVYQMTARWSFSAGVTGIFSRQYFTETLGVNGEVASADASYRLNRYQTIGLTYSYTHFSFLGQLGRTNMHAVGASYATRLGRRWEFSVYAGATRADSLRGTTVQLDPTLAQLLGFSTVFEIMHTTYYTPYGEARLVRAFRRGSWDAHYVRSVMPGNGLFATSSTESADTGYAYTGLRRLTLQAGAGYNRATALTQTLGRYRGLSANGGFAYSIGRGFALAGHAGWNDYSVAASNLAQKGYDAGMGLSWNPGTVPLPIW